MSVRGLTERRIAIVGAGFGGICLAIQLKKAGLDNFTLYEKADQIGGTWRENVYPGAACDSPSFAYCYSFEQKTDWSRKWSPQPEILAYMDHCVGKYGVLPHVRFETEIREARFDEAAGLWRMRTADGEELSADVLVSAVGQLNRPFTPDIPGLDGFQGERFHSALWNSDVDLTGKTVGVVGNAASAIQFIPQIAPRVQQLYVFQRSANWMLPKLDRAYTEDEHRRFARQPWRARLYRWWLWASFEARFPVFRGNRFLGRRLERFATADMRSRVSDPGLQEKLIPDYPIGGKRILISDDYYEALQRPNVDLVTEPIERITADTVVTEGGAVRRVDVLILATGFKTTELLAPMAIRGLEGVSLETEGKDGARAYLGLTVPGFPNLFMMYGPNTNLGHNSILFMLECQARYILDAVGKLFTRDLHYLDLRREVMDAHEARIQRQLGRTVWAATDHSWYKNDAGRITNNWAGTTTRYWWNTRRAKLGDYRQARSGSASS